MTVKLDTHCYPSCNRAFYQRIAKLLRSGIFVYWHHSGLLNPCYVRPFTELTSAAGYIIATQQIRGLQFGELVIPLKDNKKYLVLAIPEYNNLISQCYGTNDYTKIYILSTGAPIKAWTQGISMMD